LAELIKQHQYHFTPDDIEVRDVHAAVAIDCEMGTAMSGDSELIQVTLIDYFSGAVLINNFVQPDVPMQHLNTRFSGVSWLDINEAKKQGTCLAGKAGARAAIWKYVGLDTIVVGHGASNDLRALRWIHGLVVDSFVLEYCYLKEKEGSEDEEKKASGKEEEGRARDILRTSMETLSLSEIKLPGNNTTTTPQKRTRSTPGRLSLKTLSKQHMGRDIQMAGNKGHDSLEDAIAAKDLVHWSIMHADRMSYHSTN
jgi:RNA exonuclease 1